LESQVVLHQQPPSGAAEAEQKAAKAQTVLEHIANNARGYSTTQDDEED
jgi:hypothetical protein